MQPKPRYHCQIKRIEHILNRHVAVEDAMLRFSVEHHQKQRQVTAIAGTPPNGALAIDQCKHRYRLAAERAWGRSSRVPAHAYLSYIWIAQSLRGHIHAMLFELVQYAIASCAQVADSTGRMLLVPVIPDSKVREHIDVNGSGEFIP